MDQYRRTLFCSLALTGRVLPASLKLIRLGFETCSTLGVRGVTASGKRSKNQVQLHADSLVEWPAVACAAFLRTAFPSSGARSSEGCQCISARQIKKAFASTSCKSMSGSEALDDSELYCLAMPLFPSNVR